MGRIASFGDVPRQVRFCLKGLLQLPHQAPRCRIRRSHCLISRRRLAFSDRPEHHLVGSLLPPILYSPLQRAQRSSGNVPGRVACKCSSNSRLVRYSSSSNHVRTSAVTAANGAEGSPHHGPVLLLDPGLVVLAIRPASRERYSRRVTDCTVSFVNTLSLSVSNPSGGKGSSLRISPKTAVSSAARRTGTGAHLVQPVAMSVIVSVCTKLRKRRLVATFRAWPAALRVGLSLDGCGDGRGVVRGP